MQRCFLVLILGIGVGPAARSSLRDQPVATHSRAIRSESRDIRTEHHDIVAHTGGVPLTEINGPYLLSHMILRAPPIRLAAIGSP